MVIDNYTILNILLVVALILIWYKFSDKTKKPPRRPRAKRGELLSGVTKAWLDQYKGD